MAAKVLMALVLLISTAVPIHAAGAEVSGSFVIAGNGPEQRVTEKLVRAFEKANPRVFIDILWDQYSKPLEMLRSGKAHLAVTGKEEPDLKAVQIGWDGIAVMVNVANTTREVTSQQVADLFMGKVKFWSDLGGPETKVVIIDRAPNSNIRDTFEQQLGITGKIPDSAKVIGPDDKAIKTVVGTLAPLSAVTYLSLQPALEAVTTGVAVRLLPVDKVEPEEPTVKDGRYKLRRPVLLLTKQEPSPLIEAFEAFVLSNEGQNIVDAEGYTPLQQNK